jgi:predicted  nucleic acid-binding Zn-ribbon protein
MKIRGERECKDCGGRWSYYETGSVSCPECGSRRSVGVDDRTEHTAGDTTLDLSSVRARVEEQPLREVAGDAAEVCREFVGQYGFVDAGDLQPLSDTYLAAVELRYAGSMARRSMQLDDDEEYYLLALLRGAADGERPDAPTVPDSFRSARGLAAASTVDHYRADVRRVLADPTDPVQAVLAGLREHQKRVEALDGDVPAATATGLCNAAQTLGRYLVGGDEDALAQAQHHLEGLGPEP